MNEVGLKQFADYRAFLIAHVQDCKKRKPDWTYGVFARQLGLKDPSSITKIIQGQREPGPAITGKLIKYFQFSGKDAQYFHDLVRLRKMKDDPRLAVMIMEKMGEEHPTGAVRVFDDKAFMVISQWYCMVVMEMVRLDQFVSDPKWISQKLRFKVTPTQAQKAIEMLTEVGILERINGKLEVKNTEIRTHEDLASEAGKRHFEGMLEVAKEALRKVEPLEREFGSVTLAMKKDRIPEAKQFVRDFKAKFIKMFHEKKNADFAGQMMIQFFPMTKFTDENKDEESSTHVQE